jgi:hypothetical protein
MLMIQETAQAAQPLTAAGWATMIFSLSVVYGGVIWCYRRVLRSPQEEKTPIGLGA